jgi:Ras-related protein Rab-35
LTVGNKNDDPNRKQVQTVDAKRFADSMSIYLFETSAKENINVEPMFDFITRMLLRSKMQQKMREQASHEGIRLDKGSGKRRKSKCC